MIINEVLDTVTSIAKGVIGLGLSLVTVALVVDVLFPGTTNIVASVSGLVESFTSGGLTGLIVLVIFIAIASRT
ncbi:MAG TPA: hypothetical protein DCM54_01170 [Gammaproteobacteria bacterium]|jgi:hypothetical protein|nr:hypothetical protein [Deltaproteobacteria bacterium]HAK50502.1 hypothetical protein [Gammaproteobacteria bacterium]|tara:strand:+ start:1422 stop:1643 length:222 start_codon:yes stop_codon:yes gene_type:complete